MKTEPYIFDFAHPRNCPGAAGWWFRLPSLELFESAFKQVARRAFQRHLADPHDTQEKRVLEHGVSLALATFLRLSRQGRVLMNRMGGMCSGEGMTTLLSHVTKVPVWPTDDAVTPAQLSIHCYRHGGHYYIGGAEFICKFNTWDEAHAVARAAFPDAIVIPGGVAKIPLDNRSAIA